MAYSFFNLGARFGVGGQRYVPASLPSGVTWYPLYVRLDGPQSRSGRVRKILPLPGLDTWTSSPVASPGNYTSINNILLSIKLYRRF